MKRWIVGLAAVVLLFFVGQLANAETIAECGFNDALGINADATFGSPYEQNKTIIGLGATEPGWTGVWQTPNSPGMYAAKSTAVFEGDLAMRFYTESYAGPSVWREYTDQHSVFYLDLHLRIDSLDENAFLVLYTGEESFNARSVATHVGFRGDGKIQVKDGGGNTQTGIETTSLTWQTGEWTRITERIDVPNQTWQLWVNGVEHVDTDPLNFRHTSSTFVDDLRFLFNDPGVAYVDAIHVLDSSPLNPVPEPSTFAALAGLLAMGGIGMVIRRRKR